jgi:hypothetical protein
MSLLGERSGFAGELRVRRDDASDSDGGTHMESSNIWLAPKDGPPARRDLVSRAGQPDGKLFDMRTWLAKHANVIWRTADLLGVSSPQRVEMRQQIAAERSVFASS